MIYCYWADNFIAHSMHFISFLSIVFITYSVCFTSEIFETVGTYTKIGEEIKQEINKGKQTNKVQNKVLLSTLQFLHLSVSFWSIDCTGWHNEEYKSVITPNLSTILD